MSCEIKRNKRGSGSEKIGSASPNPQVGKISTRIRNLIISQLEAAAPASLPLDIISRGVRCECEKITEGDVLRILRGLTRNAVILAIGESGFHDRYRLVDGISSTEKEEE